MICVSYTRAVPNISNMEVPRNTIGEQNELISAYIKKKRWKLIEKYSDRKQDRDDETAFLKMKKVRLTYRLPLSLSWLQGLTVWGEANNVFSLTKYRGLDPEVSVGNGVLYQGVDAGMLPQSRSFNFGVTINL